MITNEREYRITKAEAKRFEEALAAEDNSNLPPELKQVMQDGLESQLQELREEMAHYEALQTGDVRKLEYDSLTGLPEALIMARIAMNLTQKELAERLGMKEQQIQRYEAERYAGASLERIKEVAEVLEVQIHYDVTLPS